MTLIVWDIGIKKMKERKHYFSLIFGKEKYKIRQGSADFYRNSARLSSEGSAGFGIFTNL